MKIGWFKQRIVVCLMGFILAIVAGDTGKTVQAASFSETILYSAAAFAYINSQLNNLNDHHQTDLLQQTQKRTGVDDDEQANAYLNKVANHLMSNGLIKGHYAVYITPDKGFNAFCTLGRVIAVNRGTIAVLDEDEFAVILGHEMGHGEQKDPVEGTKKVLGLSVLIDLYSRNNSNLTSAVLGTASANYINNEVITMQQEWNADNAGFDNAVAAGYNPGGGAAAMVKLRTKLGEMWHEGLSQIINPNNHPKTSDRVKNFSKRLTAYSYGHITVKNDKIVQIDGVDIITPAKTDHHLAEERAYLVAGKLAKEYHNHTLAEAYAGQDGTVYMGSRTILTPLEGDGNAQDLADRINDATKK